MMKVSDYYPIFYAENIESETRRFTEELGFSVKHKPKIEYLDYVVLENEKKGASILCIPVFRRIHSKKDSWVCV